MIISGIKASLLVAKWLLACPYRKCQPHMDSDQYTQMKHLIFLDEVQGRLIKAWFGVSKYTCIVLPLHLELLLGGAKHLNFISPPRPNPSVYLIPYFQSPFTCPLIRGVIWGFGTATACITSGVVPPHAILSIMHALAVSVVKDNLPNPISFHAEPHLWPVTSLLHP